MPMTTTITGMAITTTITKGEGGGAEFDRAAPAPESSL